MPKGGLRGPGKQLVMANRVQIRQATRSMPPAYTVRTEANAEAILGAIRKGVPRKYAAGACQISKASLYNWVNEDPDFARQVDDAEHEFIAHNLAELEKQALADPRNWQARAWVLERRFPEEFGKREAHAHEMRVSGTMDVRAAIADVRSIELLSELEANVARGRAREAISAAAQVIDGEALPAAPARQDEPDDA